MHVWLRWYPIFEPPKTCFLTSSARYAAVENGQTLVMLGAWPSNELSKRYGSPWLFPYEMIYFHGGFSINLWRFIGRYFSSSPQKDRKRNIQSENSDTHWQVTFLYFSNVLGGTLKHLINKLGLDHLNQEAWDSSSNPTIYKWHGA